MPLIAAERQLTAVEITLGDLSPEEQCKIICQAMARPVRTETVRRKFAIHWPILQRWAEERPDLFDEVMFSFVAEIEQRNGVVRDDIAFTLGETTCQ